MAQHMAVAGKSHTVNPGNHVLHAEHVCVRVSVVINTHTWICVTVHCIFWKQHLCIGLCTF